MRVHRYLHYDVFSSAPLAGNQLAVFPDGSGLDATTMQAVAREMNFSETTFVLTADDEVSVARVRIFTPGSELPMAGHPTIGTTFALVREGRVAAGADATTLGLGIGPTRVALEWEGDALRFAWMRQPRPQFGARLDRSATAAALGVTASELAGADLPVEVVSCGVPFVMVALATRGAVDRAELDRATWRKACEAAGLAEQKVFLFALDDGAPSSLYSRMFGPVVGVSEDPGTGSASGPVGAYLVRHGLSSGREHRFLSRQGVKMRRPCEIHIRIGGTPDAIERVEVGGTAVCAGDGLLHF
jgi:trans-2,3-dihydro-3-hydroxyanthranilate isomerase